jgi:hypothetical protein
MIEAKSPDFRLLRLAPLTMPLHTNVMTGRL